MFTREYMSAVALSPHNHTKKHIHATKFDYYVIFSNAQMEC